MELQNEARVYANSVVNEELPEMSRDQMSKAAHTPSID